MYLLTMFKINTRGCGSYVSGQLTKRPNENLFILSSPSSKQVSASICWDTTQVGKELPKKKLAEIKI